MMLLYLSILQITLALRGLRINSQIFGGEDTAIEKHPYQLSFRLNNQHICGAALIKSNIGITASHCIERLVTIGYSVRAGSNQHTIGGWVVLVRKILIHKDYKTSPVIVKDMAIFQLSRKLPTDSNCLPIPLPHSDKRIKPGMKAFISGWGRTEQHDTLSTILKSALITIINKDYCDKMYHGLLPSDVFCALDTIQDTAKGDSGGAVVSKGVIIGITSFGANDGNIKYPAVYTDVTVLLDDINKMIDKF